MRIRVLIVCLVVMHLAAGCKKSSGDDDPVVPAPIAVTNAPLHADGRWFKDAKGRVVILRGINIGGVKRFPHNYNVTEADWDNLYNWGMNAVRLLIIWEAIEPQEGVFNDAFFDKTAEQIQWAAERGIYILLDMHQDVWGPSFGGDGAPEWATDTSIPFTRNNPWGINYFAPAVMANYDNFFSNTFLQDHFAAAWLHAVQRFIDRPNVIGYDLYNEPYFGTGSPWGFERDYLGKFQDRVAQKIREVDPDRVIFYEPMIFTSGGVPSFLPPPALKGNIAFAPHFYDPVLGMVHQEPYDENPSRMAAMMDLRDKEVKGLGDIPWLLGEFGIASGVNSDLYVRHIYEELDKHMASGTYWAYGRGGGMAPLNSDGSERPRLDDMVRPFPMAIAGTPYTFSFDRDTKVFTLSIKEEPNVQGPTEIYIPEARHYPGGFIVESTGTDWSYEYDGRILKWHSDSKRYTNTITVRPAP